MNRDDLLRYDAELDGRVAVQARLRELRVRHGLPADGWPRRPCIDLVAQRAAERAVQEAVRARIIEIKARVAGGAGGAGGQARQDAARQADQAQPPEGPV